MHLYCSKLTCDVNISLIQAVDILFLNQASCADIEGLIKNVLMNAIREDVLAIEQNQYNLDEYVYNMKPMLKQNHFDKALIDMYPDCMNMQITNGDSSSNITNTSSFNWMGDFSLGNSL